MPKEGIERLAISFSPSEDGESKEVALVMRQAFQSAEMAVFWANPTRSATECAAQAFP